MPSNIIFVAGKNNIIEHVISKYDGILGIYMLIHKVIISLLIIANIIGIL